MLMQSMVNLLQLKPLLMQVSMVHPFPSWQSASVKHTQPLTSCWHCPVVALQEYTLQPKVSEGGLPQPFTVTVLPKLFTKEVEVPKA
jgi:hypothetical protein